MTGDPEFIVERASSDTSTATPKSRRFSLDQIPELINDPAVRKMALYGAIGGVIGLVACLVLFFIVGQLFGDFTNGSLISASRFNDHPEGILGEVLAVVLYLEVLVFTLVAAVALVGIGIGLGVRRVGTFQDNPDGIVAIAVALFLCIIGFPFGLLNPITMALFAGSAYLMATYRQRTFRYIALIVGFLPAMVPLAVILFALMAVGGGSLVGSAGGAVGGWGEADNKYKEDIIARERAKQGGQGGGS